MDKIESKSSWLQIESDVVRKKTSIFGFEFIRCYPVHPCKIKVLKSRSVLTGIFRIDRIKPDTKTKEESVLAFELYPQLSCTSL